MGLETNVNLNISGLGGAQPGFQNGISPIFANPNPIGGQGGSDSILQMEQQMLQIMEQIMQLLQEMEQQQGGGSNPLGGGGSNGGGNPLGGGSGVLNPSSNETMMQNATFSSTGDPHLNFSGSAKYGMGNMSGHADNMSSQTDLIDANGSFDGGYQVSTTTTAPNSSGITYNASATVAMNNGATSVTMGQNGQVSVMDNGQNVQLQKGQSIVLSNGATVAEGQDGKVTVSENNNNGGSITTTLGWNGSGVDVNGSAQNVMLGGYEVGLGQQNQTPIYG